MELLPVTNSRVPIFFLCPVDQFVKRCGVVGFFRVTIRGAIIVSEQIDEIQIGDNGTSIEVHWKKLIPTLQTSILISTIGIHNWFIINLPDVGIV